MKSKPYPDAIYHGDTRRRPFFEGWYFKQANGIGAFAAIPGVYMGKDASGDHAFIQIIFSMPPESRFIRFPVEVFSCTKNPFEVRIGPNVFSMDGVRLDLPEIGLKAELTYIGHVPLRAGFMTPTIMGPFAYLPGMQCRHGVLSLWHRVNGSVHCGSRQLVFDGADGYIEKDWGGTFPDSWVWMQCGDSDMTLMCAIASIPLKLLRFTGVICVLRAGDEQHRFATYNGAHVTRLVCDNGHVGAELERKDYRLIIEAQANEFGHLQAPTQTGMDRQIAESISARFAVRLERKGERIIEKQGLGGLELLEPQGLLLRNQKK